MVHYQPAVKVGGRRHFVSAKPGKPVLNQESSTTPELGTVDYPRPAPSVGQTLFKREKEKRQGFDEFHKVKWNEIGQHQTENRAPAKYFNLPRTEQSLGGRICHPAGKRFEA